MKIIKIFLLSSFTLLAPCLLIAFSGDTITWNGQVELTSDVVINDNQILIIQPGTSIVSGIIKIEISGSIISIGTEELPINFYSFDTIGLFDTASFFGGWKGIHLLNNPNGNAYFEHCSFSHGKSNIPGSWYGFGVNYDTLSANQGGVIRASNFGNISFTNCMFNDNMARTSGGAIYTENIKKIELNNSLFNNNRTHFKGGALYCNNNDTLIIDDVVFKNNSSWYQLNGHLPAHGGAIYLRNDYPETSFNQVSNSHFFNNLSLTTVYSNAQHVVFYNNLMTNNYNGATLYFSRLPSTNRVFNNTIAHNYFFASIPGIYTASNDMKIYNNILWDNLSDTIRTQDLVIQWHYNLPTVFNNVIWEARSPGGPMIDEDPLFTNPAPGYGLDFNGWEYDWSLQDISPAINSGTPDTTGLSIPHYDLHGNPRIFGGRIDMGAYENQNVWVSLPDNPLVNARMVAAPNPFRNAFTVELFGPEKVKRITVYNQTGTPVRQMETLWHEGLVSIDMSGFPSGLYILVVEYENGTIKTEKMVKL